MIDQILKERYQIQQQLGKQAGRRTYLARDLETAQLAVVKLLLFTPDFAWEHLKLFEREAAVLQTLSHPSIPQYLDYFEVDLPDCKGFALIQTYIEASSLEEHLQKGRFFSEPEIRQLAKSLLEILQYLHSHSPCIIHRDIKPSNILSNNRSGNSIGQVYLVDFGAVQTVAAREGATITIVGTYGYMPPEQFGGRAVPASDLYSLGATFIYLLTGTHPADLPTQEGRIQFENLIQQNPGFIHWLQRMVEPSLERRFKSAEAALIALETAEALTLLPKVIQPMSSKIVLNKSSDRLEILIPPSGFHPSLIGIGLFATAWNTFLIFWTGAAFFIPFPFKIVFLLFSLPFWGAGISMVASILFPLFGKIRLLIDTKNITQTIEMLGCKWTYPKPSHRTDIYRIERQEKTSKKDSDGDRVEVPASLSILAGQQTYKFNLSEPEMDWIAAELSDWLSIPTTGRKY